MKWLLSVFPLLTNHPETDQLVANEDDGVWLPVHFTVAVDPTTADYYPNLDIILKGIEEISPGNPYTHPTHTLYTPIINIHQNSESHHS